MKSEEIAKRAASLVGGDRKASHGNKLINHTNIAILWNALLTIIGDRPLNPHDVCNLMELLKVARRYSGKTNDDDYIDGAGYAALAGEIKARIDAGE